MRVQEKTDLRVGFLGWGDLDRFVSREQKGGASYGERKLKIKGVGNGSQILERGRKGSRVHVGGWKATLFELGGTD